MNKNICDKIKNSKFSFSKNFLYFLIAPLVVFLIGIILISTCGFNLGTDYKSGTVFKVYTNYDAVIDSAESYDLNKTEDYNAVYNKITDVLSEHNIKIISYRTSSMDILEYPIVGGQAVEVVYQNSNISSSALREEVLAAFNYQSAPNAVSSFDATSTSYSFDFVYSLVACVVFAIVVSAIYLGARYKNWTAAGVLLLQVAIDLFALLGVLLITRVTINSTIGVVLLVSTILSICNVMHLFMALREGEKQGKYEKLRASEIADNYTKETLIKRIAIYATLIAVMIIMSIIAVSGVRDVMIAIFLALIIALYNSVFILPNIWATFNANRKKRKIIKD